MRSCALKGKVFTQCPTVVSLTPEQPVSLICFSCQLELNYRAYAEAEFDPQPCQRRERNWICS